MRLVLTALIFCLVAGSFQSCVSKKQYDELVASKEATDRALAETQTQVKGLQEEKDALQAEYTSTKERLEGEIAGVRTEMNTKINEMNTKLNMTQTELDALKKEINDMFGAYTSSGLSMEERNGRLYLVTDSPVNFRSSSSSLSKDQREAIDALASKLKSNPAIKVTVEGHTDNKQFASGSGTDNWDLSYARAKAVASRLIKQGVKPEQISVTGYGEHNPADSNDTADGRSKNRRTVVSPNPDLGTLMKAGGDN